MNKRLLAVFDGPEIVDHFLNFGDESATLFPGVTDLAESVPEGENDDLGVWPNFMDAADQFDVAVVEFLIRDVVVCCCIHVSKEQKRQYTGRGSARIHLLLLSFVPKLITVMSAAG